jgi:hypothetical protein
MSYFHAYYEDWEKARTAAIKRGMDKDNNDSVHDYVDPGEHLTSRDFQKLDDAVSWLVDNVNARKTTFGVGTVREIEEITKRCRYCTCRGKQAVKEYYVSDEGIDGSEDLNSECLDD